MFASTDGLPGPLKLNRFGSRGTITPKERHRPVRPDLRQPLARRAHRVDARHRTRQRVETRCEHQHIARIRRRAVRTPSGVIASIGSRRRFTSRTLSRLNVS